MFCDRENDTFVTVSASVSPESILLVNRNEIAGAYGKCVDAFLVKKSIRKCRILGNIYIGERLNNSTYTGILGMIQSKRADLYLRGEADFFQEDWIAKSVPIQLSRLLVGHIVHRDPSDVQFFNLLDNFNLGLMLSITYLLSFIGILMICFLIHQISHRLQFGKRGRTGKAIQNTVAALGSSRGSRLSAIAIFVLCTHVFLWQTQLFLTNNIKTNKVVVDTSQLIKNEEEIRSSPKVACILKYGLMYERIRSSPPGSLLGMIYAKTRIRLDMKEERELFGERCLLSIDLLGVSMYTKLLKLAYSKDIFVVGEQDNANLFWSTGHVFKGLFKTTWMLEDKIYPHSLVFYYNPDKPRLGWEVLRSGEHGMANRMFECIEKQKQASLHSNKISLFSNLKDFAEEFSGFSNLVFPNFRYIFIFYFLFGLLVFAASFAHHGLVIARKTMLRIKSRCVKQVVNNSLITRR